MAILYAFDEHKNKVAFDGANIVIIEPITIPMQLPDGSILFYDRGEQYGEYLLVDGEIERQSEGVDNGTYNSQNWRYLICDSANLSESRGWGPNNTNERMTDTYVGYGLPNTETLLSKYGNNSSYIWQLVKNKRNDTGGKKWFVPSKDELDIIHQNKKIITQNGGGNFPTGGYWSSSEYNINYAWDLWFSTGSNDNQYSERYKNTRETCRLLRRI